MDQQLCGIFDVSSKDPVVLLAHHLEGLRMLREEMVDVDDCRRSRVVSSEQKQPDLVRGISSEVLLKLRSLHQVAVFVLRHICFYGQSHNGFRTGLLDITSGSTLGDFFFEFKKSLIEFFLDQFIHDMTKIALNEGSKRMHQDTRVPERMPSGDVAKSGGQGVF